jgi:hypothetical protein
VIRQFSTARMGLLLGSFVADFLLFNFHGTCVRALLKKLHLFRRGRGCKAFGFGAIDQFEQLLETVLQRIVFRLERIKISLGNSHFHMPQKYNESSFFRRILRTFFVTIQGAHRLNC